MKTKFKYLTLAVVALLMVGVSSCSSDDDVIAGTDTENVAETKSVFLKINNGPSTRAVGSAQEEAPVKFNSGHLYFTDAKGVILKYYTITNTDPATTGSVSFTSEDPISLGTILTEEKALTFTNLPGTVNKVYIVGNTKEDKTPTALNISGNISLVQAQLLDVTSQVAGESGNIVHLYGAQVLTGTESLIATVYLAPTVARIELPEIKANGNITGFTVDGIFIDSYYQEAQVDGTVGTTLTTTGTKNAGDYVEGSDNYKVANKGSVYDLGSWGGDAITTVAPDAKVWGYNLFAGPTTDDATGYTKLVTEATGVETPRIIIRLSSVKAGEGLEFKGPQFITIRAFTGVGMIKPGHVYSIKDLVFNESNLSPNPNTNPINVEVTVKLASWVKVEVTPEI